MIQCAILAAHRAAVQIDEGVRATLNGSGALANLLMERNFWTKNLDLGFWPCFAIKASLSSTHEPKRIAKIYTPIPNRDLSKCDPQESNVRNVRGNRGRDPDVKIRQVYPDLRRHSGIEVAEIQFEKGFECEIIPCYGEPATVFCYTTSRYGGEMVFDIVAKALRPPMDKLFYCKIRWHVFFQSYTVNLTKAWISGWSSEFSAKAVLVTIGRTSEKEMPMLYFSHVPNGSALEEDLFRTIAGLRYE